MRKCLFLFLFLLLASPLFAQQNVPKIQFESVPDFFKLPEGMNFGECPGVAVDSKHNIYVFTRTDSAHGPAFGGAAAKLLEFNPQGQFMREIGKDNYAWSEAHSVRIDKDDNIWAVDKGSDMVVKFNQQGRILFVLGRKKEAADGPTAWGHPNPPLPAIDGEFRQPTDSAWDSQGNVYITDGYVNSRVAKFDKYGNWIKQWGESGTGPGQFHLPHSIVIDSHDTVFVGDRSNHRIQVFDTDGKFIRMFMITVPPEPGAHPAYGNIPSPERLAQVIGSPNSMCITPGANPVLYTGENSFPGRMFKVGLDGTVLGVIGSPGKKLGQFSGVHQLACLSDHEVYAAETTNWRVQKLIFH